MNMVHNSTKMDALKTKIRRMKFFHGILVGCQFLPLIFGIAYFFVTDWRIPLLLLFVSSVLFNVYLFRKIRRLVHLININEMTHIAYRVENGERFSPDHKDYLLYKRMLFALLGKHREIE
jgi:hypothetical protein